MTNPLSRTLDVLSRSAHTSAIAVLGEALDGQNVDVRAGAAEALLHRGTLRAQSTFVERCAGLGDDVWDRLKRFGKLVDEAIDRTLLAGAEGMRRTALAEIRRAERFGLLSSVLKLRELARDELAEDAEQTIRFLVERLHTHRSGSGEAFIERFGRHVEDVRRDVTLAIGRALKAATPETPRELLIESLLRLGHPGDVVLRQLLWDAEPELRERAVGKLRETQHPGAIRFLIDSLSAPYPHPVVFECVAKRTDGAFVEALLRWLPASPTTTQRDNLGQLESVAMLVPDIVQPLADELQAAAVRLANIVRIGDERRSELLNWVLRGGSAAAREAASGFLDRMNAAESRAVVFNGLADENPDTQAWATHQLRKAGVEDAMGMLLQRLDDESEKVREAAREELGGFGLDLLLRVHDHLPRELCRNVGGILRKIDPDHADKLRAELNHPVHQRRINAVRAAVSLGLHTAAVDVFVTMIEDPDPVLRRMAAEVLGDIPQPVAVLALKSHFEDENPRVRDAVHGSLERLRKRGSSPSAPAPRETLQETAT